MPHAVIPSKKRMFSLHVPEHHLAALTAAAARQDRPVAYLIRQLIEDWYARQLQEPAAHSRPS